MLKHDLVSIMSLIYCSCNRLDFTFVSNVCQ